ncbi:ATP-dependent Clp protease proteolytic subunit [Micromonospora arborensis]|uniref:ATP-dependent Clp protease proteolytic subunit n=1 Tax=Micromonospora arborensis TaxID=2116518 RepID=A0A318NMX2_9ACTN|nr:ATP-dependent Clp protease proteolytic subunit [Micromonospora arborensis]PYC69261.1 ATP-dependent Clp protease proteolytic subunit [Micromonospora arborensis]
MIGYDVRMLVDGQPSFGDQVFERLLRERIIFLGTEVTEESANQICAQILLLAAEDADRDIFLYINSPGGSVSAGMAVYDTMRYVRNDVATLALGFAGSMGQFLLCAGAAGKRYALPHSRIMMHQPSGGIGGTVADITIQAENMLHVKRTMQELIAQHSGRTLDEIQQDWDRDRWFTAEQAREYGLIDEVLTRAEQLPST